MLELAERVEAATAEEQRDLLDEAFLLLNPPPEDNEWLYRHADFEQMLFAKAFESAAMTLVPKGLVVLLSSINPDTEEVDDNWHALVGDAECVVDASHGKSAALALTAAALRARASRDAGQ